MQTLAVIAPPEAPGRWEFRPGSDRTRRPDQSTRAHVPWPAGSRSVRCARCCSTARRFPIRDIRYPGSRSCQKDSNSSSNSSGTLARLSILLDKSFRTALLQLPPAQTKSPYGKLPRPEQAERAGTHVLEFLTHYTRLVGNVREGRRTELPGLVLLLEIDVLRRTFHSRQILIRRCRVRIRPSL